MTKPGRYLLRMGLFILAVAGAAYWLSPTLVAAFLVSPVLNGLILSVLVFRSSTICARSPGCGRRSNGSSNTAVSRPAR